MKDMNTNQSDENAKNNETLHNFKADVSKAKEDGSPAETHTYQADVSKVLSLIINNVYSTKEVFIRELVSNASDAIYKLISAKNDLQSQSYETESSGNLKIQIIPDKENRTLTIKDNGIGFTRQDLVNFLGTIAASGTKMFQEMKNSQKNGSDPNQFIGQFGLGFYSAFLVAEKIDIITKHPKDEGFIWSSVCESNSYEIIKYDVGDMKHGSSIILTLKEGEEEYLDSNRIKNLIKKHCLFINHPILVFVEKEVEIKDEEEEKNPEVEEIDEDEPAVEQPEEKKVEKKVKKVYNEERVNNEFSVWNRKLDQIPEEDMKKFYKSISNDYDDYLAVQSWHFEGLIDLKIILFIPKRAKLGFFDKSSDKPKNFKIFSSNVFVTDAVERDIVPECMDFLVGAVSSSNFPMNISREFLQGSSAMNLLKSKLSKCVAEMLKKLSSNTEKYNTFYKEFSSYIKLAVRHYTDAQQESFAKLLRYPTNKDNATMISLDEYLSKVDEAQKQILFITGLSKKDVETSLCLNAFKDRLVLLMSEAVDEFLLQGFKTYKGFDMQNITMEGVESLNPLSEEIVKEYEPFVEKIKEVLKDSVEKVIVSNRFADIPASILIPKYGTSSTLENILKAQPNSESNPMLSFMMKTKKIFELNIDSPVVKELKKMFDANENEKVSNYANFLYNCALVGTGFTLENKSEFITSLYSILSEAVASSSK